MYLNQGFQAPSIRALGIGERLDAAIKIYIRNFKTLMKAVLVIAVPGGILEALILISYTPAQVGVSNGVFVTGGYSATSGQLINDLLQWAVGGIVVATCYRIVGSYYLTQPVSWTSAVQYGVSKLGSILWIEFLYFLGLAAGVMVFVLAIASHLPVVLIVIVAIVLLLAVIWFFPIFILMIPTLLLDGTKGARAIARTRRLVRKRWGSTAVTILLAELIMFVPQSILGLWASSTLINIVSPQGNIIWVVVVLSVVQILNLLITAPLLAAVAMVISIDLRVRQEGLDLQLLSAQMGIAPLSSIMPFVLPTGGVNSGYGMPPGYPQPTWSNLAPGPGQYAPPGPGQYAPSAGAPISGYPPPSAYGYPPPGYASPAPGGYLAPAPYQPPPPPGHATPPNVGQVGGVVDYESIPLPPFSKGLQPSTDQPPTHGIAGPSGPPAPPAPQVPQVPQVPQAPQIPPAPSTLIPPAEPDNFPHS